MEELMEPIIQIKNVTKTFIGKDNQVEALKGISLDINKGDIYGIIGMSGAGKSTLVRCLNYLEKPTTGTVVVEDQDLSTLTEAELRKVRTLSLIHIYADRFLAWCRLELLLLGRTALDLHRTGTAVGQIKICT